MHGSKARATVACWTPNQDAEHASRERSSKVSHPVVGVGWGRARLVVRK